MLSLRKSVVRRRHLRPTRCRACMGPDPDWTKNMRPIKLSLVFSTLSAIAAKLGLLQVWVSASGPNTDPNLD